MSRLINAEDVKALINGLDSLPFEEEVDEIVDRIPTAYDVDTVIEQLEELVRINMEVFSVRADYVNLAHVIKIVKDGGIDEDN